MASSGTLILPIDRAEAFKANLEAYDKPLVTWTTYQARRGESLDAIARHHGLTLAQIKAANGDVRLDKRGRLRSAGPIMVPMKPAQAVKVSQVISTGRVYTVRGGDTLYGIALAHRTSVDALLEANSLTASTVLHPGLKLRLP